MTSAEDPISEIPIERFDVDELFEEDRQVPGKVYVREGGFIPGVEERQGERGWLVGWLVLVGWFGWFFGDLDSLGCSLGTG